jgi:hypothetical protein
MFSLPSYEMPIPYVDHCKGGQHINHVNSECSFSDFKITIFLQKLVYLPRETESVGCALALDDFPAVLFITARF